MTQFCGERVCPPNLSTTPKVIDRGTAGRHRVVRAVLPKPRPMDANGNPGHGLVTVATAAGIIVTKKTMGVASPESASEVQIRRALPSSFAAPFMPIVREPLLLRKEETNSDSLENEQTRLVAAFDALTEQQAKLEALFDALAKQRARTEDSVLDHSVDAAPTKRNFLAPRLLRFF